jgi:hypothetical protein
MELVSVRREGAIRTVGLLLILIPALDAPAAADEGATRAAATAIRAKVPSVERLFVNCPAENTFPASDGSNGIGCEWRGIDGPAVRTGSVAVVPVDGTWQARDLYVSSPFPRRWRSCSRGGLDGRHEGQRPLRLSVYAVACSDAKFLARDIGRSALLTNLRIPRHFTEAWYGTNSLGFVTNTFKCTGKARLDYDAAYPYARETARCANRFGDRFIYTFLQST